MSIFDSPYLVFAIALVVQALAAYAGDLFQKKGRALRNEERQDFDILRTASLTLLGLLIGFSFAMAVSRYDQRKNFEVAEAKAIGTEYLRADLLPAGDAAHVRALLRQYISQRIAFYLSADDRRLGQIDAETKKLQADL
ncbi:MAG: hypothetical protein WA693_13140, partial [Pseudolabrys sp.]